ncbi:HU family DNA-binding protein [Oceanicola sp. S124]|uniref:HU family DNA-binding protein n=1 Tax=Oceanicola sp. S124 TaxID=1042378 RepID=UPI000255823F|nr:HU family DNA-binding protein [Oceanicola sp. S124]
MSEKKTSKTSPQKRAASRAADAAVKAARTAGPLTEEQSASGPAARRGGKTTSAGPLHAEQPESGEDVAEGQAPGSQAVRGLSELKKKELVESVVARSGVKKKDAKPVVEAMLTVLGEALGEGRELSLHPLGKLRVTRTKDLPNGKLLVTRIRQSGPALEELDRASDEAGEISAKETLAEDGEGR